MKLKWLDLLFIGLTIIGSVYFVRVQAELAELHKQRARIHAMFGEMKIEDPEAVTIKAIDTKHPWQWAWRVYLPDNAQGTLEYRIGQGSSGSLGFGSSKQEFISRLSLTELKDGRMGLFNRFEGGSSFSSFGSKEFCKFLREHRDELQIEQLGDHGVEKLQAGKKVRLFRMTLPESLASQAEARFPDHSAQKQIPIVLEVTLELP